MPRCPWLQFTAPMANGAVISVLGCKVGICDLAFELHVHGLGLGQKHDLANF